MHKTDKHWRELYIKGIIFACLIVLTCASILIPNVRQQERLKEINSHISYLK